MSKIVSTRLDAQDIEDLNEIAKRESLDRAALTQINAARPFLSSAIL